MCIMPVLLLRDMSKTRQWPATPIKMKMTKEYHPLVWWLTSGLSDWPVIIVFHLTPERRCWCSLPRKQPKRKAFGNEAMTWRGRSFLPAHLSTQSARVTCVTYCKLVLNVFLWLCLQVSLFRRQFIRLSFKTIRQAQQVWEWRRRPPQTSRVDYKLIGFSWISALGHLSLGDDNGPPDTLTSSTGDQLGNMRTNELRNLRIPSAALGEKKSRYYIHIIWSTG